MLWRMIGIISLGWGGFVFYRLSTTPLPPSPEVSLHLSLEFTIYFLSLGWLAASSLIKVGLILKKRWIKLSIISCFFFIFLLINMGLAQMSLGDKVSTPPPESSYPYNLVASWFISWFWIDSFLLISSFIEWMVKKRLSI